MPLTRLRNGFKALVLRHKQAPDPGPVYERSEQQFPFTKLPFDIRLMVYDECLTASSNITIGYRDRFKLPPKIELVGRTEPAWPLCCFSNSIILTCRMLYEEAMPVIYSRNCFFFSYDHMLVASNTFVDFTDRLSPAALTHLRKLKLTFPPLLGQNVSLYEDQFSLSLDAMRKMERLQSLHLYALDSYWSSDLRVLRLIDCSRGSAKVLLEVCADELCYPISSEDGEASEIIAEVEQWGWQFIFA